MNRIILLFIFVTISVVSSFAQDSNVNPATVKPQSDPIDTARFKKAVNNAPVTHTNSNIPDLIGTKAQDLMMRDMNMNQVVMSEVKTPYLILIFWDASCGHCQIQTPILDSLYKVYLKKVGCEVMGVSLDANKQEWLDFVAKHKLEWLNVWDPLNESDFRNKYQAYSLPLIFILGKDRKIKAELNRVEDLRTVMDDIIDMDKNAGENKPANSVDASKGVSTDNTFNVYPNPFLNSFMLYLPEFSNKVTVTVFSIDGKRVFERIYSTPNSTLNIDLANISLAKGYYIVKIQTDSNLYSRKLAKE